MKFEEFENILNRTFKEFQEIDKIGFIGILGSMKIERDIDLIIIPNKGIKKGEFLKSLCNFLELLKENLNKEKTRLIAFNYSFLQEETEYLSKIKKGKDIFLHVNSFPDLMPVNEEVINSYINSKKIYGEKENLKKIQKTSLDFYYNYLFLNNCLFSGYPKNLETNKIQKRISYIYKFCNGKIDFKNKTNKQAYFECCDFLDSNSKNN